MSSEYELRRLRQHNAVLGKTSLNEENATGAAISANWTETDSVTNGITVTHFGLPLRANVCWTDLQQLALPGPFGSPPSEARSALGASAIESPTWCLASLD